MPARPRYTNRSPSCAATSARRRSALTAPRGYKARGMRWLVDGMNVIGSRPDGWWRDRHAAVRRLVTELAEFAAESGDDVSVVFDGRAPRQGPDAGGVDVEFAPGGRNAADDRIAARVGADPNPATLRVVTSDRELAERVRGAGAEVVGSGGFRRRIDRRGA